MLIRFVENLIFYLKASNRINPPYLKASNKTGPGYLKASNKTKTQIIGLYWAFSGFPQLY